mmetsp:Transcript_27107/g.57573  ORF Transcript_27107/g.57573 Transcript_27107/m.57573 type:complete len:398 (-) Transcript_27107:279-1472(-)
MASGILRSAKYSAGASAAASAALNEPLLPNKQSRYPDSLSSVSGCETEDDGMSSRSEEMIVGLRGKGVVSTIAVSLLVVGGLAASTSAMVAAQSAVVFLMGGICVVNSPAVAHRQLQIARGQGVRASVNNIRKEIEFLTDEIDFLINTVDDLQTETDELIGIERELRNIATQQGTCVKELIDLVNENESILGRMKGYLRQMFVASMAKIVMRSDRDGDMKIDSKEAPLLALRLQMQLEPYGMKLDTDTFVTMIREDNDIFNVLKFCGEFLFEGETNDKGDNEHSVDDSEVTFDFEPFCRSLDMDSDQPKKLAFEEKAGMATVDDKLCKGSVEVARGGRMTLMHQSNTAENVRRKTIVKEVKRRQTMLQARRSNGSAKWLVQEEAPQDSRRIKDDRRT